MLLIYPFCLVLRPLLYLTFEGKIRRRNTSSITTKRDSKCKTDLILFFFVNCRPTFFLFCMLFLLAWTLGLFWPTWTQRANRQGTLINTRNNQTNYNFTHICDPGLPFGLQWNAFHTRTTNRSVPCAWTQNCLLLSAWPQSDTNEKNLNQFQQFIGSDIINHNRINYIKRIDRRANSWSFDHGTVDIWSLENWSFWQVIFWQMILIVNWSFVHLNFWQLIFW